MIRRECRLGFEITRTHSLFRVAVLVSLIQGTTRRRLLLLRRHERTIESKILHDIDGLSPLQINLCQVCRCIHRRRTRRRTMMRGAKTTTRPPAHSPPCYLCLRPPCCTRRRASRWRWRWGFEASLLASVCLDGWLHQFIYGVLAKY